MVWGTGLSGFLGSHLKAHLPEINGIAHQDIHKFSISSFDKFFFLSSYGNLASQTDIDLTIKANLSDLIYVLSRINFNQPFQSFVYTSSSSAMLKRQTVYSRCKRAAEELLLSYMERYNAPICIIRPFSITGVGEQSEHLIPKLIHSCFTGERMDFVPHPTHDFIDVEDVISGMINLSDHKARGIFELGTGTQYSNQEVLEIVEKVTGKKANLNIVPTLRDYDTKDWVSNNYNARRFGWLPKKSLEKSITEMVEAYGTV